jgi:hypothetical protein
MSDENETYRTQLLALLPRDQWLTVSWPPPTSEETRLHELAATYFRRCDAYDAQVCTGCYKGEPVPATNEERRAVEQHAQRVIDELEAHTNYSRDELHQAIREYARHELSVYCPARAWGKSYRMNRDDARYRRGHVY